MGIVYNRGTEGPRHDPYQYDEYTVELQDGAKATLHEGLGEYVECWLPGQQKPMRLEVCGIGDSEKKSRTEAHTLFFNTVWMTPGQVKRSLRKAQEAKLRPHRSHGGMEWAHGFPGEELLFCKCGALLDSTFNLSAIE